ncbi:MAG TPA: hypothetical protein VF453_10560, partial [Burkholderiaceae bacterium]
MRSLRSAMVLPMALMRSMSMVGRSVSRPSHGACAAVGVAQSVRFSHGAGAHGRPGAGMLARM